MYEYLRPYEKCESLGPEALTDAELIGVIIKTGCQGKSAVELANELLMSDPGDGMYSIRDSAGRELTDRGLFRLMKLTRDELTAYKGIGRVKSLQIICISELARRIAREQAVRGLSVDSPGSVAMYYMEELRHKSEEEAHLMLLDNKGKLLRSVLISKGTVNAAVFSPREVFIAALHYSAASMILIHNHPSGDPSPSPEDVRLSRELHKLSVIMNIPLRDSVIIGDNRYYSFMEQDMF